MSDPTERRGAARFITILPLRILDAKGEPLDATATAHDLTANGFKGECQIELQQGAAFHFALDLPDGLPVTGQAVAVWVKKHDFSNWVGGKIVKMSWGDKRRLKAAIAPPGVEWGPILDQAFKALVMLTVLLALHRVMFERPLWRRTLFDLLPSVVALVVMGWSLMGLLKRR